MRLFVAFAALVGIFAGGLLVASSAFRRMDRELEELRAHEERMRLALSIENAVHDQAAHQTSIVMGEHGQLADFGEASQRVDRLERALAESVDEPAERAWIEEIRRATAEIQHAYEVRIADAFADAPLPPAGSDTRPYELTARVEDRLHDIFSLEHERSAGVRKRMSALQRDAVDALAALLVLALIFSVAVGLYIRRSVARPVARLVDGTARLAAGRMETRIAIDSRDEFAVLAARFNGMVEALELHQERLVHSEKLASVGRLAAGFAHEISNPLSVILGYVTLHGRSAEGRLARDLGTVEREARRCQEIVQDLLELARPGDAIERVPFDVRALCEEVLGTLGDAGQLATCEVTVVGEATSTGDRQKLRQVVVNLVKNAVEAAGPQGQISVQVAPGPGAVRVSVSDSGPGVPDAVRARIFEPFFTTKRSGTGLGLAVSRAIVRAHGGDIDLDRAEAGGATFTLSLPHVAA